MSTETKFLDYSILNLLNERSVEAGREKNFYFDRLPIKESELYPITAHSYHTNGTAVRIRLVLNESGDTGELDILESEYTLLPVSPTPKYMRDAYESVAKAGIKHKDEE